jgi:hypothetical protein
MTLLAELFDRLEHAPMAAAQRQAGVLVGGMEVGAVAPIFAADQRPTVPPQAPAPERAPEAASEPKRNAWTITRGGKPICTVCGAPMTRDEALAEAQWRWPDADIAADPRTSP